MKVAIIGYGTVGRAFHKYLGDHHEVIISDPAQGWMLKNPEDIYECDLVVICVPTPSLEDGSCDTSIVEGIVNDFAEAPYNWPHILIKSTVPPGTTDRLVQETGYWPVCFSPEYISESTYNNPVHKDMASTGFHIVGGPKEEREWMLNFFQEISGPYATYYGCSNTEAELIKYMANAFMATKVTFANEFYDLAQRLGVDWQSVREGWLLDERIGRASTSVFPDKRGFGGKCLPKDLDAILYLAAKIGTHPQMLLGVQASNQTFQGRNSQP